MYGRRLAPLHDDRPVESIGWHTGTSGEFVQRVRAASADFLTGRSSTSRAEKGRLLFQWATDERLLHHCWRRCAAEGGTAPGPNGWRFSDFSRRESREAVRALSQSLRQGEYQRGAVHRCQVPKDSQEPERGTRTITVLNIEDRVVHRALYEILRPLRRRLGRNVYCVGSGRGRAEAVAAATLLATGRLGPPRTVWVGDDIINAFDNVPLKRLQQILHGHLPSEARGLVDLVLQGVGGGRKGVIQGSPLSPLLLDLYLHHVLDLPWQKQHPDVPLIRYADDLLLLCRTESEARDSHHTLAETLRPTGLSPKRHQQEPCRLTAAEMQIDWLGYSFRGRPASEDRQQRLLDVRVPEQQWDRLNESLGSVHQLPDAPTRAVQVVTGWINDLGPSLDAETAEEIRRKRSEILGRIEQSALQNGLEEIPSQRDLAQLCRESRKRWRETLAMQYRSRRRRVPGAPVTSRASTPHSRGM